MPEAGQWLRRLHTARGHGVVEGRALGVTMPLPLRQVEHEHDCRDHQEVKGDPLRAQQEAIHKGTVSLGRLVRTSAVALSWDYRHGVSSETSEAMGHSHPVTDDWLSQVFGTQVRIASETRIGDGLVGMNLRLELLHTDSDRVPDSIIAKLPSPDPTSRATGIALRNYEREVKFYRDVASTVQINAARCFHSELDEQSGDFVLLLEDLAPAAQGDQVAGCSIHHARVAVLELAKLHGPRWDDSSLADIEWLQRHGADDAGRFNMLWSMFLPGFLVTYAPYLSPQAIGLIERFGGKIGTWLDFETPMKTVTHGDYRLDNCMVDSDGQVIAVLDWEICTLGDPMADLGLLQVYWTGPDDDQSAWTGSATTADGFLNRADLVSRYAQISGRDVSQLPFYVSFAYWKLACILEGVYARYLGGALGQRTLDELAPFELQVQAAAQRAAETLDELT